jgi:hypothetical protein
MKPKPPIVVVDPVIRPAAIILPAEGVENLDGFVVQALPDTLMRVLILIIALTGRFVRSRHRRKRPA